MFLERSWPAQEWPVEQAYTRVIFNKVLLRDEFGIIAPPAIDIKYIATEVLILKKSLEGGKKKRKGGKNAKVPKRSPVKRKRDIVISDNEDITSSSNAFDSVAL